MEYRIESQWKYECTAYSGSCLSTKEFWRGMKVYLERPHLVNKRLLAIETEELWSDIQIDNNLYDFLTLGDFSLKSIERILFPEGFTRRAEEKLQNSADKITLNIKEDTNTLILRSLLPKQAHTFDEVSEAVVLDIADESASFFPVKADVLKSPIAPAFPYKLKLFNNGIVLLVVPPSNDEIGGKRFHDSTEWLKQQVLVKIVRWTQQIPNYPIVPSLRLLQPKNYRSNLHYLKTKYAKKFLEIWPNYNATDPGKYVYEDISIAAYLLTLWEQERESKNLMEKQTFLDLGCGNGLLDHILSSEGYKGKGIDLRKRKIWDAYGPETNLVEESIEPSDKQLYPGYDWIIGNHADELTPWIPVIAARSSYDTRVFLIPCCFYTFDGKFARKQDQISQYQSYLTFLDNLCTAMGFQVEIDKLRIPSTKRTCLVCSARNYNRENIAQVEKKRKQFITSHLKKTKKTPPPKCDEFFSISTWNENELANENELTSGKESASLWAPNFTLRESSERVKNCSKLDKAMIDKTIKLIVSHLLTGTDIVKVTRGDELIQWNRGKFMNFFEICNLIEPDVLKCMKSQNGGVQTLLRNHGYIFEVRDQGVQLRLPSLFQTFTFDRNYNRRGKRLKKTKPYVPRSKNCFFHFNHPQGCPLKACECTFSHENLVR